MIDRYIKELLNEHHRVIVPDLGAFLYKGETSRTMYFNEFLRFNDGLLLNYITEQGKIDKIEAAKQIKAYVEETNKNLQARKKVVIQGIGYIYLDENDKIQLHPDIQELQTEEPQSKPSFTLEESKASEPVEPIIIPQRPANESQSEITPPMSFDFSDQTKPEIKTESPKPAFQAPSKTNVKPASQSGRKTPPPPKAKSNRTIIWIASIAVLIIITLLYLFILKPLYEDKQGDKKAVVTNANLDTIVNITNDSSRNKIEPREKTVIPLNASRNKKYYLVAGCFVQENNADKIVQKLSNEGFSPEKFAKIEKMYFVSIASFGDKASAEKQLRELKAKGYKELWIKYH